jgi:hypothetical protein
VTTRLLAVAMLLALVGTALPQPTKQPKPKEPLPPPKAGQKAEKPDVRKLLATRLTVDRFEGKFKDAVAMLSDKYGVSIVTDPHLGEGQGAAACDAPADDMPVKFPKLVNVRLDTVLNLLAAQLQGKVLVYPEYVKIVPDVVAAYETGVLTVSTDPNNEEPPLLSVTELVRARPLIKRALVSLSFKNKPLSEVIDEIAETTGATVAVSPLLPAEVRQAPVTVSFANTPVEAAVRTLCEMTECGVIEDANVLLVTTRQRAAARAKEDADRLRAKHPPQVVGMGNGFAGFLGGPGGGALTDPAAEIAKLKEQNEQLKRQLEEIQKQLKKPVEK